MEIKNEKSYVTGIIGALIGALIGTIPWILVYIYGNMLLSLLALIIGYCSFYGYKLLNGKLDKKTPWIIVTTSLIAITIAALVIIPLWLLKNEGFTVTLNNLQMIYNFSEIRNAILRDYAISILFTILGISGVVKTIKETVGE